jgi:hypothetical protein
MIIIMKEKFVLPVAEVVDFGMEIFLENSRQPGVVLPDDEF